MIVETTTDRIRGLREYIRDLKYSQQCCYHELVDKVLLPTSQLTYLRHEVFDLQKLINSAEKELKRVVFEDNLETSREFQC